jgi:hypothetical protein
VISHRKGGRIKSDELDNRDEAMTALKGQIIFKVYMPDTQERDGIKAYLVSESKSDSYVIWMVYWEIMTSKNLGFELLHAQPLNKGYHLYSSRTTAVRV